jgi:ubiquinone/menaquinone biosynthesis C-methylase UbiE
MLDTHTIDQAKLDAFVGKAVSDLTAGYTGVMVSLGAKLGLYRAMAGAGPLSSKEVARLSGCAERYVREWLNAQAAGGYLAYHAASDTYELLPEQAAVLADEDSPFYVPVAWNVPGSSGSTRRRPSPRSGAAAASPGASTTGAWPAAWRGSTATATANLVANWLPTLDGVVDRLAEGITVADIGCGHGHSTLLMAEAFPNSRFHGFDTHAASIDEARAQAQTAGLAGRTDFALAKATTYPDQQYDLICFFDVLHDLGDPVAAARHARDVLAPGGTVMLVEPFAHDHTADNHSLTGQLYYSASTVICCAHAISEGGHLVLGAQAGEARLADVFRKAGFTHFRRAAETPFNMIFEARR